MGSVLLILFVGVYLSRAIVLPVRRAAAMAGRLAGGDLAVRMPETGVGEIGTLERSFNAMASSLEASRAELTASRARRRRRRRGASASSRTSTTARNSAWSRSGSSCGQRMPSCRRGPTSCTPNWRTQPRAGSGAGGPQEVSRGIHPAILNKGGLGPALKALARRSAMPVELDIRGDKRLPEQVEVAVYYVVSEAFTNTAKHAGASLVRVDLDMQDSVLRLAVQDDGAGGADPDNGSGLVGLRDRVEAIGGDLELTSPPGEGTSLRDYPRPRLTGPNWVPGAGPG